MAKLQNFKDTLYLWNLRMPFIVIVVVCPRGKDTFLQVVLQSECLRGHRELGSYILIEIVFLQQGQSLLFSYVFSPTERNNPHSSFY